MYWWLIYAFILAVVLYGVTAALRPREAPVPMFRQRFVQFATTFVILAVVFYFLISDKGPGPSDMIQRISREQDIAVGIPDF